MPLLNEARQPTAERDAPSPRPDPDTATATLLGSRACLPADQLAYAELIREFQAAISINAAWPGPYYGLGLVLELQGRQAEAVQAYEQYLERIPDARQAAEVKDRLRRLRENS